MPSCKRALNKCRLKIPTYCHIVIVTSLVWILIGALVLLYLTSSVDQNATAAFASSYQHKYGQRDLKKDQAKHIQQEQQQHPPSHDYNNVRKQQHPPEPNAVLNPKHGTIVGMMGEMYWRDKNPPTGPGEQGEAYEMSEQEKELSKETYTVNQFNLFICEKLSLNRSLPDYRASQCKSRLYRGDLPTASIVIVFHQEAWCTLIRSVNSIINRTPKQLILEIILVDDASTKDHLKDDLDELVSKTSLIKLIRLKSRSGLIRARLAGADAAKGDVIIFLDSHIEVTTGWIEPLLHEIKEDRTRVTVPTIDNIDLDTFQYHTISGAPQVGGFTWGLTYFWFPMSAAEKLRIGDDYSLPVKTPAMAGGLFAIERNYFYETGSYDKEMEIWGGENIEMSLRLWQCGASIWIVPCSKVGHVFRKQSPYQWPGGVTNILTKNNRRLAEVWLDEYKHFWFFNNPSAKSVDFGDVSERIALKVKLQCKSFNWYIKNIWPESSYNLDVHYLGQLENPHSKLCVDTMGRKQDEKVGAVGCHGQGGHQAFAFTKSNEVRTDDLCLDASKPFDSVILYRCHKQGGNQYWTYDESGSKLLRHRVTNQCLSLVGPNNSQPKLEECNASNLYQLWTMTDAKELTYLLEKYRT